MNHDMFSSQVEHRAKIIDSPASVTELNYHSSIYKFRDIEEVIQLAHRITQPYFNTKLIRYAPYYYLVVMLPEQRVMRSNAALENLILEYGERGYTSIHRLEEYGQIILDNNAIAVLAKYFK